MIPTITQDAPNIVPRHWCSNCGRKLVPQNNFYKMLPDNFCPGCGERIEWDKAVPVKWEPMNCDVCGKPLIVDMSGHMVAVGYYIGTTTCRNCMEEYCSQTNCLGCKRGTYPDCKFQYLKPKPAVEEDSHDE